LRKINSKEILTTVKATRNRLLSDARMVWKSRDSGGVWSLDAVRRVGLGIGGAVIGLMAAIHAIEAGLVLFGPPEMAAVFMLVGGVAAFLGAHAAPAPTCNPPTSPAREPVTSMNRLSAAGTLLADSSAFVAAWLLVFQAPAQRGWAVVIAFWWLLGVTAQTSAGLLARLRVAEPGVALEGGRDEFRGA
jgi:hypothetical protein